MAPRFAVLAIDTASPAAAVALETDAGSFEDLLPSDRRASEGLLPVLRDLVARAGLSLADLSRIAVCSGPGSFTGIRIGLATAWGLGRALEIPVESVGTLEAMAEAAEAAGETEIVALLDAGRGDLAGQRFRRAGPRLAPLTEVRRFPASAAQEFAGAAAVVALPPGLAPGRAPRVTPARALARAVFSAPGPASDALAAIYARPSAAEEKHGAAPA